MVRVDNWNLIILSEKERVRQTFQLKVNNYIKSLINTQLTDALNSKQ